MEKKAEHAEGDGRKEEPKEASGVSRVMGLISEFLGDKRFWLGLLAVAAVGSGYTLWSKKPRKKKSHIPLRKATMVSSDSESDLPVSTDGEVPEPPYVVDADKKKKKKTKRKKKTQSIASSSSGPAVAKTTVQQGKVKGKAPNTLRYISEPFGLEFDYQELWTREDLPAPHIPARFLCTNALSSTEDMVPVVTIYAEQMQEEMTLEDLKEKFISKLPKTKGKPKYLTLANGDSAIEITSIIETEYQEGKTLEQLIVNVIVVRRKKSFAFQYACINDLAKKYRFRQKQFEQLVQSVEISDEDIKMLNLNETAVLTWTDPDHRLQLTVPVYTEPAMDGDEGMLAKFEGYPQLLGVNEEETAQVPDHKKFMISVSTFKHEGGSVLDAVKKLTRATFKKIQRSTFDEADTPNAIKLEDGTQLDKFSFSLTAGSQKSKKKKAEKVDMSQFGLVRDGKGYIITFKHAREDQNMFKGVIERVMSSVKFVEEDAIDRSKSPVVFYSKDKSILVRVPTSGWKLSDKLFPSTDLVMALPEATVDGLTMPQILVNSEDYQGSDTDENVEQFLTHVRNQIIQMFGGAGLVSFSDEEKCILGDKNARQFSFEAPAEHLTLKSLIRVTVYEGRAYWVQYITPIVHYDRYEDTALDIFDTLEILRNAEAAASSS